MKFLVCKKQYGSGCDYTIGCGYFFDWVEAKSIEDIVEKTIWPEGRNEWSALEGEQALETILVIPAESVIPIDVATAKREVALIRSEQQEERIMQKERAELKRLREKYRE